MDILDILGGVAGTTTTVRGTDAKGRTVVLKRDGILTGNLAEMAETVGASGKLSVSVRTDVSGSRDAKATNGNKAVSGAVAKAVMGVLAADDAPPARPPAPNRIANGKTAPKPAAEPTSV